MPYTLLLAIGLLPAVSPAAGGPLESIGRLSDPTIRETSGIVKSRRYPDVFWIHSDSGNPPAIHAIRGDGRVVASFRVAIPNVDWEDMAGDADGHLYLGEIGNNGGRLPLRAVYRVDEPDPSMPTDRPLPVTLATYYRFARGEDRFDAESLFVVGKEAFLIAKRFGGEPAGLYSVPLEPPAPLLRPALPVLRATLPEFTEPATGASLSEDGTLLAVVSNTATRIYARGRDGGLTLRAAVRYKGRDIEAIAWDGLDLVLVTEAGELSRIAAKAWTE